MNLVCSIDPGHFEGALWQSSGKGVDHPEVCVNGEIHVGSRRDRTPGQAARNPFGTRALRIPLTISGYRNLELRTIFRPRR